MVLNHQSKIDACRLILPAVLREKQILAEVLRVVWLARTGSRRAEKCLWTPSHSRPAVGGEVQVPTVSALHWSALPVFPWLSFCVGASCCQRRRWLLWCGPLSFRTRYEISNSFHNLFMDNTMQGCTECQFRALASCAFSIRTALWYWGLWLTQPSVQQGSLCQLSLFHPLSWKHDYVEERSGLFLFTVWQYNSLGKKIQDRNWDYFIFLKERPWVSEDYLLWSALFQSLPCRYPLKITF